MLRDCLNDIPVTLYSGSASCSGHLGKWGTGRRSKEKKVTQRLKKLFCARKIRKRPLVFLSPVYRDRGFRYFDLDRVGAAGKGWGVVWPAGRISETSDFSVGQSRLDLDRNSLNYDLVIIFMPFTPIVL